MSEGQVVETATPVERIAALMAAQEAPEVKAPESEAPVEPEAQPEPEAEENKTVEGEEPEKAVAEIPLDQLEAIELEIEVSGDKGKIVEKLPIKELKLGYMRQKDYQQKTAEVARQREEVGEKVRQGIESERSQYLTTLQTLQNAVMETAAPEFRDVNWNQLATDNPAEYVRLRNRADQVSSVLKSIQSKQQETLTKLKEEQSQALKKAADTARTQLEGDIPGWNDALYQTLMKTGESFGFKPEEVGSWVDPRAIKLLHSAYELQQLKSGKPADKKVVVPPKVIKPGAKSEVTQTQQQSNDAMKRLRGSGKLTDAADVIASRIG